MEKSFSIAHDIAYHACNFLLFPPSKAARWLLVVGGSVGIPKYDVNDGVSLNLSESPD